MAGLCSSSSSSREKGFFLGSEMSALADNLSLPLRIRDESDFEPERRFKAVRIMVLPAPVSPVRTLNPEPNSIEASSITPIFFNDISFISLFLPATPSLHR